MLCMDQNLLKTLELNDDVGILKLKDLIHLNRTIYIYIFVAHYYCKVRLGFIRIGLFKKEIIKD